jgi:type II secretory pathway component GspD/PulD (secretin)
MQNQITLMSRTLLGSWILLTAVMILCNGSWAADVAVIRVKYRWASEVLPIVQSMLSPQGTVTVSARVNSLIIVDSQESIQRVRAYLDQFDKPLEQVRIHVRFYENRAVADRSVSARGRISGDNLSAAIGGKKKDGVDLSIEDRRRRESNYSEFFVLATNGSPAFIRAGQEIPYRGKWPDYTRRYAPNADTTVFQTVETGFEVTPTVAGENVHMRIVPRIAYGDRNDAIIRFYAAQTELTVTFGRWVEIGGSNTHSNEVIEEILSRGSESRRSSMVMSLMVEKP